MFKQISENETNMSMAVKKSSAESMVVKLDSMVSHSNCDDVVKIEMATDSDIHLKNSATMKIYTFFFNRKSIKITILKSENTMKISLKRSQSMLSAVAVRTPNSIASNTSPRKHRITKIRFVLSCLSKHFSEKHLIKRSVKSQIRKSQSHSQSHIFQILTNKSCLH